MPHPITQHLNEQLRDAMLAFYMTHVLPEDATVKALDLAHTFKTADDVYTYWLLDPQVSQAVPTTRVASAIASLQHYINRIYLGLEPGYEKKAMSNAQQANWRDHLLNYSLWRANQQLRHYPASYLTPLLRHDQSESFKQLESELNQFQIQPAALLSAVHSYLNRFEELATIKTLNGYIDGDKNNLAESTYYFIGKSSSQNTYYWRTLDMAQRSPAAQPKSKTDVPSPAAWTAWKKIHLSIDENVPEQTIRPVFFNGRLFVVWVQCINPAATSASTHYLAPFLARGDNEPINVYQQRLEARLKSSYLQFRLYFSYQKLDDSWSTPQACIQEYSLTKDLDDLSSEDLMKATASIAVLDSSTQPPSLFLGLSAHPNHQPPAQPNASSRHFYQAVRLDQHFNIQWVETIGSPRSLLPWLKESELAGRYLTLFAHHNRANFQFRAPESDQVEVKGLTAAAQHPASSGWNFEGHQKNIADLSKKSDIRFNLTTSVLEVTTRLTEHFKPLRTIIFKNSDALVTLTITLSTSAPMSQNGVLALTPASAITLRTPALATLSDAQLDLTITGDETGVRYSDFIRDENDQPFKLSFPPTAADKPPIQATIRLEGAHITWEAFDYFFNTMSTPHTVALSFYNNHTTEHAHLHDLFLGNARLYQKQRLYRPVLMYPKQANASLPPTLHRNNTVLVGLVAASRRDLRDAFTELPDTHVLDVQIELDPKTLRPYGEDPGTENLEQLTLIHGVLLLESDAHFPEPTILGYALKSATFKLDAQNSHPIIPMAPGIRRLASPPHGLAEFIDFMGSSIEKNDTTTANRASVRTNTCVASLLTKTASADLHNVFTLPMDAWREPPLVKGSSHSPLDFQGAYGVYFWELFLYLPWLLAHRLNLEQQHTEAQSWLRYLFDPTRKPSPDTAPPAYWRLPVLFAEPAQSGALGLTSLHQQAMTNPVYFRQALYLLYVDILLNRGDTAYRQMTRDSLAEAKLWYMRAKALLGPRPPFNPVDPWATATLDQLLPPAANPARPSGVPRLCRSLSPDLLLRWDNISARLYNLRHHLDLTGKPLSLPLYAATLTPQTLLAAYQQGWATGSARAVLRTAQAGHYRFQVVLGHAQQAVENLVQLGTSLLSLLERKEQAEYLETQQQQAWDLARIAVEQQAQAMQFDIKNQQALLAGRAIVQGRLAFFEQQLKVGISATEALASQEYQDSARWETAASVAQASAGLAMLIPNIFGTSNGGVRYEGAFHALQAAAQGMANDKRANAANLERSEQFARRAAEWAHGLEQARLELAQVDAQLQAYEQQAENTQLQWRLAQTTLEHTRSLHDTLGKRFSNAQLYHWLNGRLSAFYLQAYDSTLSLCLAAEACWQEERAQWDQRFIQTQVWNNQYRGLAAGEALRHNLQTMSNAYITHNERHLEITKTVSLRQLHDKDPQATTNKPWATLKEDLVNTGVLTFELTQNMFDDDYPGHYLRRIKNLSVSLPATLGPYEDIKAILTQTANSTWLTPSTATDAPVKKDLRVRQEVALSSGLNDSGLFTLNFDTDERYLPFEFTGAVSTWQLTFPNHTRQQAMLTSLTDIIVHLRYTAKNTGGPR